MKIRNAAKKDLPQMLKLLEQLQPLDPPIDENAALAAFEQAERNGVLYFIAEEGGLLVGACYAAIIPNITRNCSPICFIENVVTSSDCRRRGIGRKLIEAAIEYAKAQGCYKVTLQSGIKRIEAHKFYEAAGFDGASKRAFELRF
ncbi:MAG: GNAT family N-acetyltransferase [Peptococcaceae bacterium]|nr:GNAT family N-acetyltransferase [Peptococcaceae bacterium]